MVTEGLPVGCTTCFEDENRLSERRPSTSSRISLNPADGLAGIGMSSSLKADSISPSSEYGPQSALPSPSARASAAIIETPPESPRVAAESPRVAALQGLQRRDSSFRKTYDENDKKKAIPCENCALTLPKKTKEGSVQSRFENSGPILRTRKAYERISASEQPSPPKSSASSSDSETAIASDSKPEHARTRPRTLIRVHTASSNSSFTSTMSHSHYLDYTTTHEPLSPASFSAIRQSCLRTLSLETLPPSSAPSTSNQPTSPFINNPLSINTSTSSAGPIFFGDPLAGYTTAYIFRIPDPTARGRRRVYALMSLSTHRERVAMSTFSFLSSAFKELAAWVQSLAELELERTSTSSPVMGLGLGGIGEEGGSMVGGGSGGGSGFGYLSGRRQMGADGRYMANLRARGLAEIVGLPDFYIELHTRFVRLLVELGVMIDSR